MRDTYIYQNHKIRRAGHFRVLKHKKLDGIHQNYLIQTPNGENAYLKVAEGCRDYGEVVVKAICDRVGIPCAKCKLVSMQNFPQGNKLNFETFSLKYHGQYGKQPHGKLIKMYKEYETYFQSKLSTQHGVISYDFQSDEKFKDAKVFSLKMLTEVQKETYGAEVEKSIHGYMGAIKSFVFEPSYEMRLVRRNLGVKSVCSLESKMENDFIKIALLGYMTAQTDDTDDNICLAVIDGWVCLAPLFDNGACFGLGDLSLSEQNPDIDAIADSVKDIPNALWVKKHKQANSIATQRCDLVKAILGNTEILDFYNQLRNVDFEEIFAQIDKGEDGFENVKQLIQKVFVARRTELENEITRQIRLQQAYGMEPNEKCIKFQEEKLKDLSVQDDEAEAGD